ncbi:MAG: hypothetical protein Q8N39_06130 [Pelolinea sp.]|nr:hypothetical protein [Pelolinea sp.]
MNALMMISPNYDITKTTKPVSIESNIDIYEDRIRFWIIEPARKLTLYKHGGVAICYLLASYFEGFTIILRGKDSERKSPQFFRQGFLSVFPKISSTNYSANQLNEIINIMYKSFRCGLYHTGLFREKIWLIESNDPITILLNTQKRISFIQIDTARLIESVETHFNNYICELRCTENVEKRNNFIKAMDLLNS